MPEENVNLPGGLNEKTLKLIKEYFPILALMASIYINYKQAEQNVTIGMELRQVQDLRVRESKENEKIWRENALRTLKILDSNADKTDTASNTLDSR